MELYNDDCFNVFPELEDQSVDLILVDLPYAQTACKWDICIDLERMWKELSRIAKPNANYVFTTTTKFGYKLIQSNEKGFRYDLVWEKSTSVGFLNSNYQPLRNHEMIYIFGRGKYIPQKEQGKAYKWSGKNNAGLYGMNNGERTDIVNTGTRHPKSVIKEIVYNPIKEEGKPYTKDRKGSKEVGLYGDIGERTDINNTGTRHPKSVIKECTYNPIKTPGTSYTIKRSKKTENYGIQKDNVITENTSGERHPKSILPIKNPNRGAIHPTQKPVELFEYLIKTYSNEDDLVLDFCAGSGTTGVACLNTNRRCILVEKDNKIYEKMEKRIEECVN